MAKAATKEAEAVTDPKTTTYIVREKQKDGGYSETLVVGLAAYKKKWKLDHLDEDDFYLTVMEQPAQRIMDIGVRVASPKDLEQFGDQQEVAALVQEHTYWDDKQKDMKNALRARIVEWVSANVTTEEEFTSFLSNNSINTNQFAAIAYGAKGKAMLPDEFIDMFAAYVSEKSKDTKYSRTPSEVKTGFYAPRKS